MTPADVLHQVAATGSDTAATRADSEAPIPETAVPPSTARRMCGACGRGDLATFLDLGTSPIADAYSPTPNRDAPRFPLQVAVCGDCKLVQLLEVLPQEMVFGPEYSFYASASPPLSEYNRQYAHDALGRFDADGTLVVEVGCNDGDFLRHFTAAAQHVLGVDPARGPAAVARDRGLEVIDRPFDRTVASEIVSEHGAATLVFLNHVLAHVEDVSEVLSAVDQLLADDGHVVIEVQYLSDLLVGNAFDLVYHEHRNFFSLTTLERALARQNLRVVEAQLTDRQGGSIRVVAGRMARQPSPTVDRLRSNERWLERYSAYDGLQGRAERIGERLVSILGQLRARGRLIAGYGAPAKATTLFSFCELDHDTIPFVLDTTPAKQGRFIPGSAVVIKAPADVPFATVDVFMLFAWNYLSAITRQHPDYDGQWIVPIPTPVIL